MNEHLEMTLILREELDIVVPETASLNEFKSALAEQIRRYIESDLERLIYILYRVDVNETKLRSILKESADQDAAGLIADMIVERQFEKIKSRKEYGRQDNPIDDNDRW